MHARGLCIYVGADWIPSLSKSFFILFVPRPVCVLSDLGKWQLLSLTSHYRIFDTLCSLTSSYAGLHCEVVLGYSKGAGYKPGMRMDGQAFRNSWTVVNIDGSWRLVNCTWAARHVTGHRDKLPEIYHK